MIEFNVGDLVTYEKEDASPSNRYCVIHKITNKNLWGYWADSKSEARAKYNELRDKNPENVIGYYNCVEVGQVVVRIVTPAKRTIKDYLEGKKND